MERDLELCRLIMLEIEAHCEPAGGPVHVELDGFTADQIGYNTALLIQAGFVEEWGDEDSRSMNNQYECFATNLTWRGHEFLDDARNDAPWKKAMEKIGGPVSTISFSILQELLKRILLEQLFVV